MSRALLSQHAPQDLVAFGAEGERSARDLDRDAGLVASALGPPDGAQPALLFVREDRYLFAAALLGALRAGHTPLIATDTRRETAFALSQGASHVLHDTRSEAHLRVDRLLAQAEDGPLSKRDEPLASRPVLLGDLDAEGTPRVREHPLGALLDIAASMVDELDVAPGMRVACSVPPGHGFGLLLGVLLPLAHGGAMLRSVPPSGDALADTTEDDLKRTLLAAPPPHLEASLRAARGRGPARVISGVSTLDARLSSRLASWVGRDVDVRTAASARDLWSDVPPCVAHLQGRDVALAELALASKDTPGVEDAAWIAPARGPWEGRLLLALVASLEGTAALAPGAGVSAAAGLSGEPARTLRFDTLPRDPLGDVDRAAVLRRFELRPDGTPLRLDLPWAADARRGARLVAQTEVPRGYAYFDGHFPGYPLLPGAAQLSELVLPCVRRARPDLGALARMTRLKFLGRLEPGDVARVELRWEGAPADVDFAILCADRTCAAGRLHFEQATEDEAGCAVQARGDARRE